MLRPSKLLILVALWPSSCFCISTLLLCDFALQFGDSYFVEGTLKVTKSFFQTNTPLLFTLLRTKKRDMKMPEVSSLWNFLQAFLFSVGSFMLVLVLVLCPMCWSLPWDYLTRWSYIVKHVVTLSIPLSRVLVLCHACGSFSIHKIVTLCGVAALVCASKK